MPCRPRWSALTLVTTDTSLRVTPMPLSRIPPRAVSVTASSTPGSAEHGPGARSGRSSRRPRRARRRGRCRRCWTSRRPGRPCDAMWAIIRLVVVLPFVPVTATTGISGRDRVRLGAERRRGDLLGGPADRLLDAGAGHGVEHRGDGAAHRLGARRGAATGRRPPRRGGRSSGRTRTASRTGPDSWAIARTSRRDGAQREPLTEAGVGLPRPRPGQPDPPCQTLSGRRSARRPAARCRGSA